MSGKTPWERWLAGELPETGEEERQFSRWTACEQKAGATT